MQKHTYFCIFYVFITISIFLQILSHFCVLPKRPRTFWGYLGYGAKRNTRFGAILNFGSKLQLFALDFITLLTILLFQTKREFRAWAWAWGRSSVLEAWRDMAAKRFQTII